MTIRKALLSVSIGLILTIFTIGLLPFLVIYGWTETLGLEEFYTSPLFFLNVMYKSKHAKEPSPSKEEGH